MKYAILNCWTDKNKGDLGIILSLVEEIQKQDKNSNVIGVSCFQENDRSYITEHEMLRKYIKVYPAIFGQLYFRIKNYESKNIFFKCLLGAFDVARIVLCLKSPMSISNLFLYHSEKETLKRIKDCDVSISKGGSLFTDDGTLRSKIALFRESSVYLLLNKHGCKYYILGQSFGPVSKGLNSRIVNKIIGNSQKVYLREEICKNLYSNLNFPYDKTKNSGDIAFLLKSIEPKKSYLDIDVNKFNVGLTVGAVTSNRQEYIDNINETVRYLADTYNAFIHVFPQVSYEFDVDSDMGKKLYDSFPDTYQKRICMYEHDFLPQELKYLYGNMDLFIGTRLHSTIFAMGIGVPSICLAYHGTKAQGIFKELNLEELVLTNYQPKFIIEKCDYIMKNYQQVKDKIKTNVDLSIEKTKRAISDIIKNIENK